MRPLKAIKEEICGMWDYWYPLSYSKVMQLIEEAYDEVLRAGQKRNELQGMLRKQGETETKRTTGVTRPCRKVYGPGSVPKRKD